MNQTRTLVEMGDYYEKNIIEEKKSVFPPKDTFKLATDKKPIEAKADPKAFVNKNSGPENADGFKKDIIDTKDSKISKKENFVEPKKFSQNLEKTEVRTINTSMSKSIFDKLYEDVMSDKFEDAEVSDAAALGLPTGETEAAGEEGDVTVTLPRDVAQKLHEVLGAILAGEEEAPEAKEEEGSSEEAGSEGSADEANEEKKEEKADEDNEEEEEEDAENVAKEATELKELPDSAGQSLTGAKKSNLVGDVTKSLKSSGPGDAKVTDKVGNDGEKGHALVGAGVKGGSELQSKNNKVASKTSKVGAYLAGLK